MERPKEEFLKKDLNVFRSTGSYLVKEDIAVSDKYRFRFADAIGNAQIEQRLFMAAANTESVFGEATMRLDATFRFDRERRVCEIDRGTDVGRHLAKLFISYISNDFGDDAYTVERVADETGRILPEGTDIR